MPIQFFCSVVQSAHGLLVNDVEGVGNERDVTEYEEARSQRKTLSNVEAIGLYLMQALEIYHVDPELNHLNHKLIANYPILCDWKVYQLVMLWIM